MALPVFANSQDVTIWSASGKVGTGLPIKKNDKTKAWSRSAIPSKIERL